MAGLRELFLVTRPWSFIMTVIVVLTAYSYALYLGYDLPLLLAAIALVGSLLLHASVNVVNDYFDTVYGVDSEEAGTARYRPHPILHGILDARSTLLFGVALGVAAMSLGLVVTLMGRPLAIAIGLIGLLIGWGYSARPLAFKYRGLGEAAVFAAFGPVMFMGAYYTATGSLDAGAALLSAPLGLLISSVLLANNIRDIETDAEASVRTLASILGRDAAFRLYVAMIASAYLILVALVLAGLLPPTALAALASAIAAFRLYSEVRSQGVPVDFDPRTAKIVTAFGALLIIGIAIPGLIS